jgi:hypothetical protein
MAPRRNCRTSASSCFDSAVGGEGLENVVQAGQDTVLNMTENGNVVATTTVETPTLIKIAYTGS